MANVAINKSSLATERNQLRLFKRFLPSLDLKRQQLLTEHKKAQTQLAEAEARIEQSTRHSGSAPLLAETHTAFEARTGLRILERYGMTEAGMITSNPYDGERIAGTEDWAVVAQLLLAIAPHRGSKFVKPLRADRSGCS